MSQGLLLWLLLGHGVVWASRGPLRPLCRPVNATLAAENDVCPVCITFTTSICAGYCPSMVSSPNGLGPHFGHKALSPQLDPRQEVAVGSKGMAPGQGSWLLWGFGGGQEHS